MQGEGRTALSGGGCIYPYAPHPQPLPDTSGRGEIQKIEGEKHMISAKIYLHRLVGCYQREIPVQL
jgi:hypothetical protein